MAQQKKKWVAFRTNAIIPADVVGEKKDKKVNAGKPQLLPASYADHVVHDGFADFCEAPKKSAPQKAATKKSDGGQAAAGKDAASQKDDDLAAAQRTVEEAEVHLAGVVGTADEDAARELLDEAQQALAALQPAA